MMKLSFDKKIAIGSSVAGLTFAVAMQALNPGSQEDEHLEAAKGAVKQEVSRIVRYDYESVIRRIEELKKYYNSKICEVINPEPVEGTFGEILILTSHFCKTPEGFDKTFRVLESFGPLGTEISKNEVCNDFEIYLEEDFGETKFGIGALVTPKNEKGGKASFYPDVSCEELAKKKQQKEFKLKNISLLSFGA